MAHPPKGAEGALGPLGPLWGPLAVCPGKVGVTSLESGKQGAHMRVGGHARSVMNPPTLGRACYNPYLGGGLPGCRLKKVTILELPRHLFS